MKHSLGVLVGTFQTIYIHHVLTGLSRRLTKLPANNAVPVTKVPLTDMPSVVGDRKTDRYKTVSTLSPLRKTTLRTINGDRRVVRTAIPPLDKELIRSEFRAARRQLRLATTSE